ncbi:MAG TPA: glycosyltransferase, partial [Aggregatilineales bacterium]|nr:glycosyltransferase [Aggregatilineales bacterium]
AMLTMRFRNIALWLNRHGFRNSFYQINRRNTYDAVIVVKTFTDAVLEEAKRLKSRGIPVIYDANVNYYYIWGDYTDPKTQPTPEQRRAVMQITRQADHVIADSEYLRDVVRDFNPCVTWIPDNVQTLIFRPAKHREKTGKLRLIWSGIAFKADELMLLRDAFAAVDGLELWLVSNTRPNVIDSLQDVISVRWFRYSDMYYAWLLGRADVIISPRYLNNGYNMGHTEYKITLGMARNLPAIASPQPAYMTAIQREDGGIICYSTDDWIRAFIRLRDEPSRRIQMGNHARRTVERYYSTPVVAAQYAHLLKKLRG